MRRIARVLLASLLAASLLAPAALADDAGVYHAWVGHDADFCKLRTRTYKRLRAWDKSHSSKAEKRAVAVLRTTRRTIKQVIADVAAQSTSSDAGAKAKTYVQRSNTEFEAELHELARAVRAGTPHEGKASDHHFELSYRHGTRSSKNQKRARKQFKKAGVAIHKNPDPCSS